MACYLCKSSQYFEILSKDSISIWTGSSQIEGIKYPCQIHQCSECGHVYEKISNELSEKLTEIYSFGHAFASSPPSDLNWGSKRAKAFLSRINYLNYSSAIEIGCADGYLLRFLERHGYDKLIGVEPSLSESVKVGNIEFIKAFANSDTNLGKVDLIFANAVFEHIQGINSVLQFVKNNLHQNGELFFAVPNAQAELESGDPALFIHEHIHYYTKDSINFLLENNGFKLNSITLEPDAIYVSANLDKKPNVLINKIKPYTSYSRLLEERLNKFSETIETYNNIIIHGATNKLNNILGWLDDNFSFTLVDNDEIKLDHYFFGHKVENINNLNVSDYDCLIIFLLLIFLELKINILI